MQETSNAQGHYEETSTAQGQLQENSIAQYQMNETSGAQALQTRDIYLFTTINKFALTLDITMVA